MNIPTSTVLGETTLTTANGFFFGDHCGWCDSENTTARFNVLFWVKGVRRWHSITQVIKPQYCPVCGRKLENE